MRKKIGLLLGFLLLTTFVSAATFYSWRYREHATDCTALTDGRTRDLCYELDSEVLYKCEPTDGLCDTAAEWKGVNPPAPSLITNALTTDGLGINQTGVLAANKYGLYLISEATQINASLAYIEQGNSSSSTQAVYIKNDGDGSALHLNQATATSVGDVFVSANGGTGHGAYISQTGVLAANKYGLYLHSNADQTNSPLAYLYHQNASSAEAALKVSSANGKAIETTGDIYSVQWVDYLVTSTVVGWTGTATGLLYYKKVGNLVFVCFDIQGTSDATNVTFTLPYPRAIAFLFGGATTYAIDNGTALTTPARMALNGATVTIYKDSASAGWTNSGAKRVVGQFWYETSS